MTSEKAIQYASKNFPEFLEALKKLIRIPSVSIDGFPTIEVENSAKAVADLLKEQGFEGVEIIKIEGAHPYVYGEWLHAPGKPTLLLYAHHDVQPPGKESLWKSPPFEPTERNGRLYARGSADDKAGILVHVGAVASYLKTEGKLPLNVKILIEGEEEIGSGHLGQFLEKFKEKMKADIMVLTDTGNFDTGIPSITTSLRGLISFHLEVKALKQSVHSGMWGGPTPDPVIALSKMLGALYDSEGKIAVPDFYTEVLPPSDVERKSFGDLKYEDSIFSQHAGFLKNTQIIGGNEIPAVKLWRLPSISVNTILAGNPSTPANIINESVHCKIGIRFVPDMDAKKTLERVKKFLTEKAPWGVELHFSHEEMGNWWLTNPEGSAFEKASNALTKAFGNKCVFVGQGGSIPFVGPFSEVLGGVPALLIGVEDPYTNAHSENESLHLEDFRKSILGAIYMYESLASE